MHGDICIISEGLRRRAFVPYSHIRHPRRFQRIEQITEEKTNDNTVYGNEDVLLGFMAESEEFLRETLGMTEAQIETVREAQLKQGSFDSTLQSIADEICNRLGIEEEY